MSKQKSQRQQPQPSAQKFTTAEWVALAVSAIIVFSALALLIYDLVWGNNTPPTIEVNPDFQAVREAEGDYYLPVTVTNRGGRTVESVAVHFVLETEDDNESNSLTFRFLAGGEQARGVVIFSEFPSPVNLRYTSSYLQP